DTAAKALKILKYTDPATGAREWYYLESRQAIGFDGPFGSNLNYCRNQMISSNILSGLAIHWNNQLLDMTPGSLDPYCGDIRLYQTDAALTVGGGFSDPDAGVPIAPLSVSSSGASIAVTLATPTCARATPTVTASPASQTAPAGSTVAYTISVTNNDGPACLP